MNKLSNLTFALILVAPFSHLLSAAQIPTLFSTGMADATTPLPDNAVDPHNILTQVPPGALFGPSTFVVDSSLYPLATNEWLANSATSKWISAQPNQTTFPNDPGTGNYTFRTTFDLSGFDPANAQISGQWTMDNLGLDLLLNGNSTGITAPEPDFTNFQSFSITGGFVAGLNSLDFVIRNEPYEGDPNPMGLRVELSGTAELVPEPSSLLLIAAGTFSGLSRRFNRRTNRSSYVAALE